jgi:hypothetical protein
LHAFEALALESLRIHQKIESPIKILWFPHGRLIPAVLICRYSRDIRVAVKLNDYSIAMPYRVSRRENGTLATA